jgi:hypothetical protein
MHAESNLPPMDRSYIFFHVPKTAGTSLLEVLVSNGCQRLKKMRDIRKFKNSGAVCFSHLSVQSLLDRKVLEPGYFNASYKFSFVRNPWDRLVSIYHYKRVNEKMRFQQFVEVLHSRWRKQRQASPEAVACLWTFEKSRLMRKIAKHLAKTYTFYQQLQDRFPLPRVGLYNEFDLSQANPQVKWLTGNDNNIMVDRIYRFESIAADFSHLSKIIGLEGQLAHVNKSSRQHYKAYYTNHAKNLAAEIYEEDIKMFNYTY